MRGAARLEAALHEPVRRARREQNDALEARALRGLQDEGEEGVSAPLAAAARVNREGHELREPVAQRNEGTAGQQAAVPLHNIEVFHTLLELLQGARAEDTGLLQRP